VVVRFSLIFSAITITIREQVLELSAAVEPVRVPQAGEGERGRWLHAPVVRAGEAGTAEPGPERFLSRGASLSERGREGSEQARQEKEGGQLGA